MEGVTCWDAVGLIVYERVGNTLVRVGCLFLSRLIFLVISATKIMDSGNMFQMFFGKICVDG
jgi:hypothetical protein